MNGLRIILRLLYTISDCCLERQMIPLQASIIKHSNTHEGEVSATRSRRAGRGPRAGTLRWASGRGPDGFDEVDLGCMKQLGDRHFLHDAIARAHRRGDVDSVCFRHVEVRVTNLA